MYVYFAWKMLDRLIEGQPKLAALRDNTSITAMFPSAMYEEIVTSVMGNGVRGERRVDRDGVGAALKPDAFVEFRVKRNVMAKIVAGRNCPAAL